MVEVQLRNVACQLGGLREAGALVAGGEARDGARLRDHVAHRRGLDVGAARRALATVEVHGDAEPAIALILDGFDLAEAHRDVQALLQAHVALGLRGPETPCLLEREGHDVFELRDARGVDFLGHEAQLYGQARVQT